MYLLTQTIDVNVTFPDEYPAEHLAGKASVFEVKVTEIREDDDIKLDDEFAKTFGTDDLAALKAALSDRYRVSMKRLSESGTKRHYWMH